MTQPLVSSPLAAYVIGIAVGGLSCSALVRSHYRAKRDRWEADAEFRAKRDIRRQCGWLLVELAAELQRLHGGILTTPYPRHAPMRSAFRGGVRRGLTLALGLVRETHRIALGTAENGQSLHPSEQ